MTARRAGIYVRVSLDKTGEGLAVARQEDACRELCRAKGWQVAEVFKDNDTSATRSRRRPAYQEMLRRARQGELQAIVGWHVDRLTRRPRELEDLLDLYDQHGVALATVTGDINLGTPQGKLMARQLASFAAYEMDHKSERQRAKYQQLAREGKKSTGPRPFGYERDGRLNRAESKELRRTYKLLLAGASLGSLVRDLNARGVRTSFGKEWSGTQLKAVLLRARNAGLRTYRGEVVAKAEWPAIVSEDVWRAAVAILTDERRKTRMASSGFARVWLGSGLYRCGVCGDTMVSAGTAYRAADGSRRRTVYRCRTRKHTARYADPLDDLVTRVVLQRLALPDAADLLVDRQLADYDLLATEAQAVRERIAGLAKLFADGVLDEVSIRREQQRLSEKLEELEAGLSHRGNEPVLRDLVSARDASAVWAGLSLSRRQAVIDLLMTVTVKPETTRGARRFDPSLIQIEWKL